MRRGSSLCYDKEPQLDLLQDDEAAELYLSSCSALLCGGSTSIFRSGRQLHLLLSIIGSNIEGVAAPALHSEPYQEVLADY